MTALDYVEAVRQCYLATIVTQPDGCAHLLNDGMTSAIERIKRTRDMDAVVHLVGNGGSASIVGHAQNDFSKAANVRAKVYQDIALFSAYANDCGYERSLCESVSQWARSGDVLIAVSSSGESQNILEAVGNVHVQKGVYVVTFSGFDPENRLRWLGDLNFWAPSSKYAVVENAHAILLHCLTDGVANA